MAIPKLAMIPSGYKAGKLYSVLPTDGVGDFTVSRASSATRVNAQGLIETMGNNVPRLDYSNGGCPVLLTEPQSTNLVDYSEDFTNVAWNKAGATIVSNTLLSPNGTLSASTLGRELLTTSYIGKVISKTATSDFYTAKVYVAKSSSQYFAIRLQGTFPARADVCFDVNNGTISLPAAAFSGMTDASAKITSINSDWWEVSLTAQVDTSTILSFLFTSREVNSYLSGIDELNLNAKAYIFGAQLEQQSYATSYIKTEGTAITRVADDVSGAGNTSTFNSTEGVVYFEGSALDGSQSLGISDGTINNRVLISLSSAGFRGFVASNSDPVFDQTFAGVSVLDNNKIAIKYKLNDFSLWVNGVEVLTDTIGVTPINLSELAFNNGAGGSRFSGKTKQIQIFDTALTDAELITLTTL